MKLEIPTNRSEMLRKVLVATVSAETYVRPRPAKSVVFAAIGAFALAGALTGGAFSVAVQTSIDNSSRYVFVAATGEQVGGRLVGTPVMAFGSGQASLALGEKPKEASTVVVSYTCDDPKLVVKVGGRTAPITCGETTTHTALKVELPAPTGSDRIVTVSSSLQSSFVIWASWAKPLAQKSAQQKLELSHGEVSRDEYLAAFNRMVGCMTAGGYAFDVPPQTTTLLNYVTNDTNDGYFSAVCYPREFEGVDIAWQIQNEDTSETANLTRACLTKNGIVAAPTLHKMLDQLAAGHLDLMTCTP